LGPRGAAFNVALRRGDFLHVVVEQRGVDVVAALLDPGAQALLSVDSPNGTYGPEHLFAVAAAEGDHRVEVRPFGETSGGEYAVTLAAVRPATREDRRRAVACRAVSDGDAALAAGAGGGSEPARRLYEGALSFWIEAGEAYPAMVTRMKLGRAWWRAHETRRAVGVWEEALRDAQRLGLEPQVASLRNDLGLAYQRLGEPERARASFETAHATARRLGDLREETVSLNNLALLAKDTGDPWRALLLYDEAVDKWRTLRDTAGEGTTLHNIGCLYTVLGRLPEARDALEGALRIRRAAGNRAQQATTTMWLGWVRSLQGDFARGRQDLLRSLALHREIRDRYGEAVTLDRLGSASREAGRPARAVGEYLQALAILQASDDRASEGATLSNLGDALTAAGDPAAGLGRLESALPLLEKLGDPSPAAYAYFRRAKAKRALGDLRGSRAEIEKALTRLDSYRAHAAIGALQTSYVASVDEQYEFAVDLMMERHQHARTAGYDRAALDIVEGTRARGLLDLLARARSNGAFAAALAQNRELQRVEEDIRGNEQRNSGASETRLRWLLLDREMLLAELRPVVGADARTAVLDTAAIQHRVLDQDTLLLVYSLGERRSFVWAVTPETVESAVLPPRAELEEAVERLHRLHARPPRPATATQARLVAAEVSRVLLGGIAHRLGGKRLAIAADGVLARVPFAALPDPRGTGEPLVERHDIVTLPSASVLDAIRRRIAVRAPAQGLLAVVADPVLDRAGALAGAQPAAGQGPSVAAPSIGLAAAAVTRAARDLGLVDLRPIPFTRQEAAAIMALAPPAQTLHATGPAASRKLVLDGGLARYRIVHLATHAFLHPQHPELSGVVLSLFDRGGRPQDGFLRSYEIAELDLPAELVVLSACRTGVGREVPGEGLVGLTQSFFQAGAARVLASLWDVDDAATARLMAGFYRELLVNGRSPAAALRAAQRAMRAEPRWSAPAYWAGFVVAGEWRWHQQDRGDRVFLDATLPRIRPGAALEEDTMSEERRAATTRDGGTPGETGGTKGDKGVKPEPKQTVTDTDGGGEPGEDNQGKGTKGL
jgi:CHAT domain-containing protein/Tfp pilus assembly protein PilF